MLLRLTLNYRGLPTKHFGSQDILPRLTNHKLRNFYAKLQR